MESLEPNRDSSQDGQKGRQQGRSEQRGEAYSVPYVEPLRFTPRRIRCGTFVNAAELVRRQCPARTKLADFFNILLKAEVVLP
jgi:hypothetical protein